MRIPKRLRIMAATLLALGLTALVLWGHARYTRVEAQNVQARFQQDLAQLVTSHADMRIDPRGRSERVRQCGRLSVVTQTQVFEIQLRPNDLRAANYRAEEAGAGGR